jgi:hypothetical protein
LSREEQGTVEFMPILGAQPWWEIEYNAAVIYFQAYD